MTDTFDNLFSESRKYGLNITVAHQFISQLEQRILNTVLGNIGTIVVFRVGGEDAIRLEKEMTPTFESKDMINLGVLEFYIKMMIDGESFDPFSAETLEVLPPKHQSYKQQIIERSREKYAVSVEEVKRKFAEDEQRTLEEARRGTVKKEETEEMKEPIV